MKYCCCFSCLSVNAALKLKVIIYPAVMEAVNYYSITMILKTKTNRRLLSVSVVDFIRAEQLLSFSIQISGKHHLHIQ